MKKKRNILVLMGGPSSEYDVSLNTGREILRSLDMKKYIAHPVIVTKEGKWLLSSPNVFIDGKKSFQKHTTALAVHPFQNKETFPVGRIDAAFIAMHGRFGEDGTVQGFLEALRIPYTGSGVSASALGMDKPRSLAVFRQAGLLVPDFFVFSKKDWQSGRGAVTAEIIKKFRMPFVIKPTDAGSSVGVSIVRKKFELAGAIKKAFRSTDSVMAQTYIRGRELTCGVLENASGAITPLLPTEIIPNAGAFYDFSSKYNEGGSTHVIPPKNISENVIRRIQQSARVAHVS
ncbi:MAG: ATP-grasp domain-containing protein, partial [Candidatus Sungbacteria bacterium]|nr:ATP-grasp domain-containing protein [Candidatus Sungbacteria bacterium]